MGLDLHCPPFPPPHVLAKQREPSFTHSGVNGLSATCSQPLQGLLGVEEVARVGLLCTQPPEQASPMHIASSCGKDAQAEAEGDHPQSLPPHFQTPQKLSPHHTEDKDTRACPHARGNDCPCASCTQEPDTPDNKCASRHGNSQSHSDPPHLQPQTASRLHLLKELPGPRCPNQPLSPAALQARKGCPQERGQVEVQELDEVALAFWVQTGHLQGKSEAREE